MCTNNLVIFSFISLAKILVGVSFNKMFWRRSHGDSRAQASKIIYSIIGVKLGESRFGSSRLGEGALQEDIGTIV